MFIIYRIERSKVSQDAISDKVNDINLFDFQRFDRRHSDLYRVLLYFFQKKNEFGNIIQVNARDMNVSYYDTDNGIHEELYFRLDFFQSCWDRHEINLKEIYTITLRLLSESMIFQLSTICTE